MTARLLIACAVAATVSCWALSAALLRDTPQQQQPAIGGPAAGPIVLNAPAARGKDTATRRQPVSAALRSEGLLPTKRLLARRKTAHQAATAFLTGYLAHETGEQPHADEQLIRRNATNPLGELVVGSVSRVPPTLHARPSRGRLVDLTGEFDKPPTTYACRALIDRAGTVSELGLTLVKHQRRWLVAALTE